ncbi:MAG TPA: cytochrome D1 domain-containing protein [Pseudolabrys sp.]|nr:cytochrome D1 domain-containing protein [Pseudolabrys sp.]
MIHDLDNTGPGNMTGAGAAHGMIAVDKIGTQVLFLNPETYETDVVLDGFPKTVHELLIVPETGLAYVPIYGDGIHGRNPNPGHELAIFDLHKRAHTGTIDLRPYIAPHTLKLGPDGLIYITCENSAVVAVIDRATHKVVDAIDSGSTNGHRLIIAPDGKRLYTENEEDGAVSVIDLPARKLLGKIKTPEALAGITIGKDSRTIVVVSDESPVIFLIDAEKGEVTRTIPLNGAPKPAQIARYNDDYSVLAVSAVGGDSLTMFYGGFEDQNTLMLGQQPMDMVFRGDDLFVACQGDGSVHVVDLPSRKVRKVFVAGKGCESLGFF